MMVVGESRMRKYTFRTLGALWAVAAFAQPAPVPGSQRAPTVTASGDAVVYAKPDLARIEIGVVAQASTAQAASQQNAGRLQSVLEKLRSALGAKAEIRTMGYSLNPNYQYPRPGGQPTISGYTASNTVQVSTDDLAGLGKLIDAVTEAGATNIQQLQFTLKDESQARAEALRQAVAAARSNAEAMASGMGLKLGRVLSLEQGSPQVIRPVVPLMASAARDATPIQEGRIEVRASVTLTAALE